MSNKRQETIADIVAQMRLGVKDWRGERVGVFDCFADRIEEAWKREREAGAEAAQICGEIGEMVGCEGVCKQSVTNCNRLGNVAKMREALESINAVDLSGFEVQLDGESSTIYNAHWRVAELLNGVKAAQDIAKATISAPPRNCDVGTTEDQHRRFGKWCRKYGIDGDMEVACAYPDMSCTFCALRWAQMPYEEGDAGKEAK